MGAPPWKPEEIKILRDMIALGEPHRKIACVVGRPKFGVSLKARSLGLRTDPAKALRNQVEAVRKIMTDPILDAERRRKISAAYTPERKARASQVAKEVNARRVYGPKSESVRQKIGEGSRRWWNGVYYSWLPTENRDAYLAEYRRLRFTHQIPAPEAKQILLDQIATDKRRLTPFERQMLAIGAGAQLIAKPILQKPDYQFTLGGVTPA